MKTNTKKLFIIFGYLILSWVFISFDAKADCSGGNLAGNLTITSSWQTTTCNTYNYYTFTASFPGQSFIFSFCQGGGSSSLDTQLEVHDNTGVSTGSYNDDFCGTASELTFNAPAAGIYRISIYRYDCQSTVVAAGTLAYKIMIPNNQDCLGAISVCQPTYYQDQSFFGYGAVLDYTSANNCPGICVDSEDLSVWYTFQVQTSGVLDFRITPNDPSSDYDWMLVNLTNNDCSVIPDLDSYPGLVTSCNAAYDYGVTGVNPLLPNTGSNCQGPSTLGEFPINNPTVNVTAGQIYYLNIQNWSATQGGYTLDFSNSTATIFDNNPPYLDMTVNPTCNSNTFTVLFNENVDCSTIDATDFTISGPGGPYTITSLYGAACSVGGTMEREFIITFSPAITTSGSFTVNYGGSAADMCGNLAPSDTWTINISSGASLTLSSAVSTLNQTICNGNPITNITWTSTGGSACTFTGLPAGVNSNYNAGTGAITISGTPTANGTFNFTVSLTGSCGAATATGTITVTSNITATFPSFGPYCMGQTPGGLPTTSSNGVNGTWSPATINTSSQGTFNFTFTPSAGQCSSPVTISVIINNGTAAVFDSFGPYCFGETPDLLPTTSNNGVVGTWSPSTINTSINGPTTYTFTPSSGACNSPIQIFIVITPLPVVMVDLISPVNCNGLNGRVSVTASGAASPYTGTGTFNVVAGTYEYLVTDHYGCKDTETITIVPPDPLEVEITKINDVNCFGKSTGRIGIEIIQGNPNYRVSWYSHTQTTSNANIVAEELSAGEYNITVTDAIGCIYNQTIIITEPSLIEAEFLASGPSCIGNMDGFIEIIATGGTQPYMYLWDYIGIDTAIMTNLDDGRYRVIVSDANECLRDLGEVILHDNPVDCLKIPDAFTPNGDGINDLWEIDNIELFPEAKAYIFNRWGQIMYYDSPLDNPWNGAFNDKFLPSGTYIYIIQTFRGIKDYTGTVTIMY
jgi:gliding motility-associated-like protein